MVLHLVLFPAWMSSYSLVTMNLSLEIKLGKALACLNPAKQRLAILGIRAFYVAAVSHLQSRLPLGNKLLRDLGCLNPLKRDWKPTGEAGQKKKEAERLQKAREDVAKSRQSLQESEDTLMHQEEVVKADLKAADELLSDATSRLHETLSATAVNKQIVNVATMMLDTAKTKRDQAMQSLQKIGEKRKLLTVKQHRLLEKALSSTAETGQKKSKAKKAKT